PRHVPNKSPDVCPRLSGPVISEFSPGLNGRSPGKAKPTPPSPEPAKSVARRRGAFVMEPSLVAVPPVLEKVRSLRKRRSIWIRSNWALAFSIQFEDLGQVEQPPPPNA